MHYIKELELLEQLHLWIKNECTGTPKQIAYKMQTSERTIHRLIEKLKDLDAAICFDRRRNTYFYSDLFDLEVSITVKAISKNNTVKLYGGSFFKKNPSLKTFSREGYYPLGIILV